MSGSSALLVNPAKLHYAALIGVGGIGAGSFFAVRGNRTVGREESRGGKFLDRRDYCKLHIISHYVSVLMGPSFKVIPVGKVGDDETGRRLLDEMNQIGIDTRLVQISPNDSTLYSFCLVYPDGSGGNLTTEDSASSRLDSRSVGESIGEFRRFRGRGVALAAPEVPLEAREALLDMAGSHDFLRVAAFTTGEIAPALERGMIEKTDLLALNRDEAAILAGVSAEEVPPPQVAAQVLEALRQRNPGIMLSMTAGAQGSWAWDGHHLRHLPAFGVRVRSTAGAGDAHLAGLISGLAAGLSFHGAHLLAALTAAVSVTSPHTIHPGLRRPALLRLARRSGASIPESLKHLLGDGRH